MSYSSPSITTSSAAWSQLLGGGLSGILEQVVTSNKTARSNPTTPATVSAAGVSTGGGLLVAGGYKVNFTEGNGVGETLASTESGAMTVATAGIPLITFPALQTGNIYRNLYVTPANGAGGSEVLYATGIITTTFAMQAVAPSNSYAMIPPTVNTTGFTYVDGGGVTHNDPLSFTRAFKNGNAANIYKYASKVLNDYLRGDPQPFGGALTKLRHAHTAVKALDKALEDIGNLVDQNAGTLTSKSTPIGGQIPTRTFP